VIVATTPRSTLIGTAGGRVLDRSLTPFSHGGKAGPFASPKLVRTLSVFLSRSASPDAPYSGPPFLSLVASICIDFSYPPSSSFSTSHTPPKSARIRLPPFLMTLQRPPSSFSPQP